MYMCTNKYNHMLHTITHTSTTTTTTQAFLSRFFLYSGRVTEWNTPAELGTLRCVVKGHGAGHGPPPHTAQCMRQVVDIGASWWTSRQRTMA